MAENSDLSLNSMRKEGLWTDIILVASSGHEIPAHKNILASRCHYFYKMFTAGKFLLLYYIFFKTRQMVYYIGGAYI